jgi:hypothetical protein
LDKEGASAAGAVTWCDGTASTIGTVSVANSLVGTTANDHVGSGSVAALTNGNYVVLSPVWNNDGAKLAGAATWGNGTGGTVGAVSAANSLVGTRMYDQVGFGGVTALSNGHYVVASNIWNKSSGAPATEVEQAGAATWGNGVTGTTGPVLPTNSLVGTAPYDRVGLGEVRALPNGTTWLIAFSGTTTISSMPGLSPIVSEPSTIQSVT